MLTTPSTSESWVWENTPYIIPALEVEAGGSEAQGHPQHCTEFNPALDTETSPTRQYAHCFGLPPIVRGNADLCY